MNSTLILLSAFLLYIALTYWFVLKFDLKTIWNGSLTSTHMNAQSEKSTTLTLFVRRILDFFLLLSLALIIIVPVIAAVMEISQTPSWGIDIGVFSGFIIDLNQMDGINVTGVRQPEFSGKTIINIDTSNLYAWYLFIFVSELSGFVFFYIVYHLRAIIMSLQQGLSLTQDNSQRIKKIGIVVIIWNLFHPLLQYFAWGTVIKEISFNTQGIGFYPAFEINVLGLLIGSMLILLSQMLKEAADIKQEQELTI